MAAVGSRTYAFIWKKYCDVYMCGTYVADIQQSCKLSQEKLAEALAVTAATVLGRKEESNSCGGQQVPT